MRSCKEPQNLQNHRVVNGNQGGWIFRRNLWDPFVNSGGWKSRGGRFEICFFFFFRTCSKHLTPFGQNLTTSTLQTLQKLILTQPVGSLRGRCHLERFQNLVILLGPPSFCDGENVTPFKKWKRLIQWLSWLNFWGTLDLMGTLKLKLRLLFHGHLAE